MHNHHLVTIWDPVVRVFHWLLVMFFIASWITREEYYNLHLQTGYSVLGLVCVRIVWGFIGSKHARFNDFIYSFSRILSYIRSLRGHNTQRYIGHNPAGGLMTAVMLLTLLTVTISGIALDGAENWSGPMSEMNLYRHTHLIQTVHQQSSDALLMLIVLHLAGVVFTSIKYRENLALAMISGKKRSQKS